MMDGLKTEWWKHGMTDNPIYYSPTGAVVFYS